MKWTIVGAGAQGRVTLDILRAAGPTDEIAFLDDNTQLSGKRICRIPVISRAAFLADYDAGNTLAIVAIGHNENRLRVAGELAAKGVRFGNAVHPSATVVPSATVGTGVTICAGAVVGTGASVGDHALINTNAVVEHDCVIEEGASICPGVHMSGRVTVERAAFVGTGASLSPRIRIGQNAIIGTGSVVIADVGAGMLAYGVPARETRPVDPQRDWSRLL